MLFRQAQGGHDASPARRRPRAAAVSGWAIDRGHRFALFPILWGLSSSLKPTDRILAYPPRAACPTQPTLEHYARVFAATIAGYYIMNSAIVSAVDGRC